MGSLNTTCLCTDGVDEKIKKENVALKCNEMKQIGARLYCQPLLLDGDNVIFLESLCLSGLIKYSIFDLKKGIIVKTEEIKYENDNDDDNYKFDIFNTVYTLNRDNNMIYFIDNKLNMKSLDLNKNEIKSLNKSIITTNNNYPQIIYNYVNKKIYILGAQKDDDEKEDDEFVVVPYLNKDITAIDKFGQYSRVIMTKQNEFEDIYIMGGQTKYNIKDLNGPQILPNDAIFICKCNGLNNSEWSNHYTPYPIHSFGIINYKNQYLFQFAGIEYKKTEIKKIDKVYVIALTKNNKYKLRQFCWYEILVNLPLSGHCHAIFTENNNPSEIVHLFTYSGQYYTFKMKQLLKEMEQLSPSDGRLWSNKGKTVLPTKSKSINNIDPKPDTEIDEILKLLGTIYTDRYQNKLTANYFDHYDDILNEKNMHKLKEIVNIDKHLTNIINKAKELKAKQQQ